MSEISVSSSTGLDGNSYTSSVSNDQLTTNDFLKLMIEELKLQDPTKPMDSAQMLSTQMQMSTLSTNQEMIKAMQAMQTAFTQTSLSNATGIIGKNVENGSIGEDGVTKAYTVRSIENVDGEISLKAQRVLYLENTVMLQDSEDASNNKLINYNVNGEILDDNGNKTGEKIVLSNPGTPVIDNNGKLTILDENDQVVEDHNYALSGSQIYVYSDQYESFPFSSVTKIF